MHHITFVPAYRRMVHYAAAVDAQPHQSRALLYGQQVVDALWQLFVAGAEYAHIAQYAFAPPTAEPMALVAAARQLDCEAVKAHVVAALHAAAARLPSRATTVCVLPFDPADAVGRDRMHGVIGYCLGAGRVVVHINPSGPDWRVWLAYTLIHEYHHSVWTERYYQPFDLAARLVFEGRADAFARLHYPECIAPWVAALPADEAQHYWRVMQPMLASTDPALFNQYMFGGRDGLPPWTGYAIGFGIVHAFLQRHPHMSVEEWTALDPRTLIAASGYGLAG